MTYKPSPKPNYIKPTHIKYDSMETHMWGDEITGKVKDWIYVSNKSLHQIIFGMEARGKFKHSDQYRTIFGADELMYVLSGVLIINNPETGETHKINKGENENIVAFHLNELAKKNNIKFNILPRFRKLPHLLDKEKIYYNKILKNNFKFIVNKNSSSYDLLINYKYIFSTYSTLSIECLAKGLRVGFVMFKSKKNPIFKYKFGAYENLPNKGLFWCASNKLDVQEIGRVFNFVTKTKYNTWIKKTDYYTKKNMSFDYKNKIFREIIKKYQ